jgi:tRNA-Thr(GGU) m(6)t(6)A37 methyltransferase TsaA
VEGIVASFEVRAVGRVESPLADVASAPRQADEGAPEACLVFEADVREALADLRPGDEIVLLTWLDRARRDVLRVRPRGDPSRAEEGVFSTRSPHRPNPIGVHRVTVTAVDDLRVRVAHLEAIDGTPILDVKPVLEDDVALR